jgi:Flp pilus assembly protein protease CpaA
MLEFLFCLFLAGIIIASIQDLKRREVDNWLNLFLIFSSLAYVFFVSIANNDKTLIIFACCSLALLFILSNLFYYGRVFAGGDAKLLFSMFAFFAGLSFFETFFNIILFTGFLFLGGAIWGTSFSIYLFLKSPKETLKQFRKEINNKYLKYFVVFGILSLIAGYFYSLFLFFSFVLIVFPFVFSFAQALEKVAMTREINSKNLRLGDWLVDKIKIKNKTIGPNWEGLTEKDLILLKKLNKKVRIKEGIPFVPSFLLAIIFYEFLKDEIMMLVGLI